MLLKNLYIENAASACDIRIENGKIAAIAPGLIPLPSEETEDFQGKLALPPFIESHVHLGSPAGTCPARCLRESSAGASARKL